MLLKLNTFLLKFFKDSRAEKLLDDTAPISKKQWIEADRIVLLVLLLMVILAGLIFS